MRFDRQTGMGIALIFSLAFNLAFLGSWGYHVLYVKPALEEAVQQRPPAPVEYVDATPAFMERLEELELAPKQRDQILAQKAGLREELRSSMQTVKDAREKLLALMQDPDADPEQIRAAEEKLSVQQQAFRQKVFESMMRVRNNLDENQRQRFGRMLKNSHGPQQRDWRSKPGRRMRPDEDTRRRQEHDEQHGRFREEPHREPF